MKPERVTILNDADPGTGPVVYWMSRDQRAVDNWALIHAQKKAKELKVGLHVVFCLVDNFLGAGLRHYAFMLKGLEETSNALLNKNISFHLLKGNPATKIPAFVKKINASMLVTDFDPLKIKRGWAADVTSKISIPFHEVDAHNIVPCRFISDKQEYAARTLRPKIQKQVPFFLDDIPPVKKHPHGSIESSAIDWAKLLKGIKCDRSVSELDNFTPGSTAAGKELANFIKSRLARYKDESNDPNSDCRSNLSPWLHFGQISAQRIAINVLMNDETLDSGETFLEELIVRRELADNFCFYNPNYDNTDGFPDWGVKTLKKHARDKREYIYTLDQFENAQTHEALWNAAQMEMVKTGKMHSYMRMYWAKKILEWTPGYKTAQDICIHLNDKYSLDGRDPNGYTGIAWSIGGVHDRPWGEREIFGTVRYMNEAGCRRKFDVDRYIASNQ